MTQPVPHATNLSSLFRGTYECSKAFQTFRRRGCQPECRRCCEAVRRSSLRTESADGSLSSGVSSGPREVTAVGASSSSGVSSSHTVQALQDRAFGDTALWQQMRGTRVQVPLGRSSTSAMAGQASVRRFYYRRCTFEFFRSGRNQPEQHTAWHRT